MGIGVLSDKGLKKLIDNGNIFVNNKTNNNYQIQPSSIDLRIGGKYIYNMPSSDFPIGNNFEKFLEERCNSKFKITDKPFYLNKKGIYVIPLSEKLKLPDYLCGRANPKSSSGRKDAHVRILTENGKEFDKIPSGYNGELWMETFPRSFGIELEKEDSLAQLRIQDNSTSPLSIDELINIHKQEGLIIGKNNKKIKQSLFEKKLENGYFPLTLNFNEKIKGYIAKANASKINWRDRGLDWRDYFDEIKLNKFDEYIIPENAFCIFGTNEILKIPKGYCAEMVDINTSFGEFRSHYAGFFDPKFCGQIVAEVRNLGASFTLRHGQTIANVNFFPLQELPEKGYGDEGLDNHYQKQMGITLGKQFL